MAFIARLDPVPVNGDWIETFEIADDETGDLIDLTGCVITLSLRRDRPGGLPNDWYNSRTDLTASTDTGEVTILGTGYFAVTYMRSLTTAFSSLACGIYLVALTIARDGFTNELIVGTLPITDGFH